VPAQPSLTTPCYVVSDHHFGVSHTGGNSSASHESQSTGHQSPVTSHAESDFLKFLAGLKGHAGSLVINGDLFDFWFEWRSVIPRSGFRVLAALAQLVDDGVPILWIGGNHDCWGGDVLQKDVGVHYMLGVWEGQIGSWQTRIEHGDGLRPVEDRRYRALRAVIRNPLAVAGMKLLHPDVGSWLATSSSSASRTHRARDGGAALRRVAFERLAGNNAPDLYIMGHTHVPALDRAPGGGIYANPGSWSEGGSHLLITDSRIEMCGYSQSAGEHSLNALDRAAKK
jgi:UDP-2,3-diacylglucosamine hydrolase